MLTAEKPHAAFVPASVAAGAAAGATVLLQLSALASAGPDGIAEALWVLGWAIAVWAVLSMVSAIVLLARRRERPASSTGSSAALVGAAALLLVVSAWLHPFVGAGWGIA
ncbi:hypothetical protein [Agrococcus sp. Ld7]|uniref:hypothetical protein n=1 Tax=Agrococcus sp. Ld7 TaxID=649148 RepID=UPI003868D2AC